MKYQIYIFRHQKQEQFRNCVYKSELNRTRLLYENIKHLQISRVFACCPSIHNKHILPLQTAATLCTFLGKNLELCSDARELPKYITNNILIVWHHGDILSILENYGMLGHFEWSDDDYDGCLMINDYGWEYDHSFLTSSSCCWL